MVSRGVRRGLEGILLTALVPIIISCSGNDGNKEEPSTPPEPEIIYSSGVYEITQGSEIANCLESLDNNVLTLSCSPEDFKDSLNIGRVLRFTGNEKIPHGFLKKIMKYEGNNLVMETFPLENAIEKGKFSVDSSNNSSNFYATRLAEGVTEVPSFSNLPNNLHIDKCFQDFCVEGDLGLNFDFGLDGEIKNFKIQSLSFNSTTTKSLELKAWASGAVNFDESINIAQYYGTPIVTPTGLVFVPYFSIDLNASASAQASLDFNFTKKDSSTIELSYKKGEGWNFDKTNETTFDYTTLPDIPMINANARVSAEAQAGILVYGVIGAALSGEAFAELDVDTYSNPWWKLDTGFDFGFALKAGIFGYGIEYNKTIASLEKTLLEADGGFGDDEDNGEGDTGDEGDGDSEDDNSNSETLYDSRDGKSYPTKVFGNKKWMTQNLDYRKGSHLCYNNDSSNCDNYGALYNVDTAGNVCPEGWGLPSQQDWKNLLIGLGFSPTEAGSIDLTSTDFNKFLDGGEFEFDMQLAGYYFGLFDINFSSLDSIGDLWASTSGEYASKLRIRFDKDYSKITVGSGSNSYLHSVRCVKD